MGRAEPGADSGVHPCERPRAPALGAVNQQQGTIFPKKVIDVIIRLQQEPIGPGSRPRWRTQRNAAFEPCRLLEVASSYLRQPPTPGPDLQNLQGGHRARPRPGSTTCRLLHHTALGTGSRGRWQGSSDQNEGAAQGGAFRGPFCAHMSVVLVPHQAPGLSLATGRNRPPLTDLPGSGRPAPTSGSDPVCQRPGDTVGGNRPAQGGSQGVLPGGGGAARVKAEQRLSSWGARERLWTKTTK